MQPIRSNNLSDLFKAVQKSPEVLEIIDTILSKKFPITILLEGSSYLINIDTLDCLIHPRSKRKDSLMLIDINTSIISKYSHYIHERFPNKNYHVVQADMNSLPVANNSIDLLIHNFTINFNSANRNDTQTLSEIKRTMKPTKSACLFSVGIRTNRNGGKHVYVSPSGEAIFDQTASYYESLFRSHALQYIKFDQTHNDTNFPYQRYALQHI